MDHLRRLIVLLLLLASFPSFAEKHVAPLPAGTWDCRGTGGGTDRDRIMECKHSDGKGSWVFGQYGPYWICTGGEVWDSTGYYCVMPKCSTKAGPTATSFVIPGSKSPEENSVSGVCLSDGCKYNLSGPAISSAHFNHKDGSDYGWGFVAKPGTSIKSKGTGQECNKTPSDAHDSGADKTSSKDNDPYKCAESGGAYGSVNGVSKCIPQNKKPDNGATSGDTKTKYHDNGDGTSTKTDTTTKVECSAGKCTTTTTTTTSTINNSTGETVKNEDGTDKATTDVKQSDPQDADSFCKDSANADLSICKGTKWGAGSCTDGVPECDGDAVQCATAQSVWQTNCQFQAGDGSTKGEQIADGNDPDADKMPWAKEQIDKKDMLDSINQDEAFGAQCPADIVFTINGRTVSISLARQCETLSWLGSFFVACALASAVYIVFGK